MAKKIFKGVKKLAGGVLGVFGAKKLLGGGKKKSATATTEDGQPIITPLTSDQVYEAKVGRKRQAAKTGGNTILGGSGTLGG